METAKAASTPSSPPAVRIAGLTWRYEYATEPALRDINLEIAEGEFIGIIGPNQAGKTTLVSSINGLIPESYNGIFNGSVEIFGQDTREIAGPELSSLAGMVFADPEAQFTAMTVEEEIVFGLENLGLPMEAIRERLAWASELTGIGGLLDKSPYDISGGQKQRVAIAAVLAMRPRILILDEPTSMIDPAGKRQIFDVLCRLKADPSLTIIVVEHNLEDLCSLATRLILMTDGQVVADGPPAELFETTDLHRLGVEPPDVFEFFRRLRRGGIPTGATPLSLAAAIPRARELWPRSPVTPNSTVEGTLATPGDAERRTFESFITVRDLELVYPDGTPALRGINLEIGRGEFVALVGQNGSGKTTLSKCLNALLRPTRGTVLVDGLDTRTRGVIKKIVTKVGYVFQNPDHQLFCRSVYDEVAYGPRNLDLPASDVDQRVQVAAKVAGLPPDLMSTHPFFLTKGLRQRVAIASILALRPQTVIVDEPTTGQDLRQSLEVMSFLTHLWAEEGHSILVVTHEMGIVAQFAQRVIVVHDGRVLLDGPTRWVFRQPEILARSNVSPPQVTRLGQALSDVGAPDDALTVDELEHEFRSRHRSSQTS